MKEIWKYKILTLVRYFGDALYYPFLSLYLVSTGLTTASIGFVLSITPIIGIIVNPLYTMICKNVKITRKVLGIITVVEALLIISLTFTTNLYLISIIVGLIAIFGTSHYGLMDSLTAVFANESHTSYTSYRMFGSIAYIIATTLGGIIIDKSSYQICFMIGASLFIISGLLYRWLKPIEIENVEEVGKEKVKFKDLLKNKTYIFFLIFHVLFMGAMNSTENFFAVYLESRGVGADQYGLIYSYFVVFEVITLLILNKFFKRANYQVLHLIAAGLMLMRYIINFLDLPVGLVIAVAGARGIAFAMILFITYQYIVKIVGERNSITAVMFLTLVTSIYTAIFNNIYGNIIDNSGYQVFYLISAIIFAAVVILAVFRLVYYKRKAHKETENK